MIEGIRSFLGSTAWRMEAPKMFGALHLVLLAAAICFAVLGAVWAKRLDDAGRVKLLAACGWILAVMEIYKQLFLFYVVNNGVYDWWYFPFQLCSVPMYLCILLPVLARPVRGGVKAVDTGSRQKIYSACLTFMVGFTFVSSLAALIYPQDFLRSYVTLTLHGFIWHGLLLFISLIIAISGMADLSGRGITGSVMLFLGLCVIAVVINALAEPYMAAAYSEGLLHNQYAAMFYLNPYHLSPQLLVGAIQKSAGIPIGLALYIAVIIAVSTATDLVFRKIISQRNM